MNTLLKLIIYIFQNYPKPGELSKPRLVKLIYLIDWKNAIDHNKQVTDIAWYFNHYGPYVEDVISLIKEKKDIFTVNTSINMYGGLSDRISLINTDLKIELDNETKTSVDFIINNTSNLGWTDFISLVYSTYPIKTNSKYTFLDLESGAEKFREIRSLRG